MKFLKEHFDDFAFHARVMPVLVILLPILALGLFKGIINGDLFQNTLYITMITIFLALTSRVGREMGKKYEKSMYVELDGMPTTIILRYTDSTIDNLTKTRYHIKLNEKLIDLVLPICDKEEDSESDIKYISAMNWLRNYANSNRENEYRVYQELKEYNFWRNLYGTRIIAFLLYLFISVREILLIESLNFYNMLMNPYPNYIALLIMLGSMAMIFFFINKKTVKNKAFDYAKALIEVCERL